MNQTDATPVLATLRPTAAPASIKTALWSPPNCRRLVLDGYSPADVRVYRFLYDWAPTKPKIYYHWSNTYFEQAIRLFSQAAGHWLSISKNQPLTHDRFAHVLRSVQEACWAPRPGDPHYFTDRHEKSDRGCQLHTFFGDEHPLKRLPTFKQWEAIQRQMSFDWPTPRPAHESKNIYVVSSNSISLEKATGFVRARWSLSMGNDRGYFTIFDDMEEANEWLSTLPDYLVILDKPTTRLIASFKTFEEATAFAKTRANT